MEEIKKIKRYLKTIIRDFLRLMFGKILYTKIRFFITHGYRLNLKNPTTWNEKIQYRKFYCNNYELAKYVDKFEVRSYIKSKGFEDILIPLLGEYEEINEGIIEKMPNSFVIKASNGGGGENVKIIKNKSQIKFKGICNKFNKYLKVKLGSKVDERYYDIYKPKIIFEKLLLDKDGNIPNDYKFHCFKRKNDFKIFIQVDEGRFQNHKRSIYNEKLEKCNFKIQPKYQELESNNLNIKNLEKMKKIVKKIIPKELNYIRIDLYNLDGKIYFGEMTLCHGSGFESIFPKEYDEKLGELWKLE